MDHSEFQIGLEFWCSSRQWRCTDVGSRVVVAIRVDSAEITRVGDGVPHETRTLTRSEAEAEGCFTGPPYMVLENVFDEYDLEGCTLEPDQPDSV